MHIVFQIHYKKYQQDYLLVLLSKTYFTKKEQKQVSKNFKIEGEELTVEKVSTTYEIVRKMQQNGNRKELVEVSKLKSDEKIEKVSFNLSEISPKEIEKHRKGGKPTFFLKMNDKYYFTEIPESLTFENSKLLGVHRCAFAGHECQRLSAAKEENGGCKKVRDRVKRIERYPWIKIGYETANTIFDCFIVIECSHYEHK